MESYILTVGTVTHALRAKRLLSGAGVSARTVKTTDRRYNGCAYALEIAASDFRAATVALEGGGITYEWERHGGRSG